MKKTIATIMGITALLLVAVPVLAKGPSKPGPTESTMNMVMISNDSVSLANSGLNRLSGRGEITTGKAYSSSYNLTGVSITEVGCCQQDQPSCCQMNRGRCGCGGQQQEPVRNTTNVVSVSNNSLALANSGLNSLTGHAVVRPCKPPVFVGGGTITTGRADAGSMNETYVNITVRGMN